MSRVHKTLDQIIKGTSDANTRFGDLRQLMVRLGFQERIRGNHHIYTRDDIVDILNLQPRGNLAKAYQVRQVRNVIIANGLARQLRPEDE